ncbi:hypothetical protein HZH66_000377 [Vespula vulgaris]|uniref:Uncharacterized protein n=1 Tax=Vespula vulgaris TaxID=7454 RepID=A0A834KWM7_VESVU|nr:hypothetical protein HZH66_000377 [Vespula vulgaris]
MGWAYEGLLDRSPSIEIVMSKRVFREFVELVIVVLIVVVAAAAVAAAAVVVIVVVVVVVVVVVSGRDRGVHPTYRCWGYTL